MPHFEGYVYPNEATQQPLWSILIVLYPYITGLVAGAFIMASLVRVFNVKALEPVYRLSLLTAFAFLLCAPLPLLFHLGPSGTLLRGDDDAAPDLADGDLRLCLRLVPHGGAAAGTVVRLPPGLRRSGPQTHAGLPRHALPPLHRRRDGRIRAGRATGSQDRPHPLDRRHPLGLSAARLRRLHFRLGQGQPVVGQRRSCRSSSSCRRWCRASPCACSITWC